MQKLVEEIEIIVNDLNNYISVYENAIIIVEGKKDKTALVYFGLEPSFILEVRSLSYDELVYYLLDKKVIDFLDEDEEGEKLRDALKQRNIILISSFRRRLFSLMHVNNTESLLTSYKRLTK